MPACRGHATLAGADGLQTDLSLQARVARVLPLFVERFPCRDLYRLFYNRYAGRFARWRRRVKQAYLGLDFHEVKMLTHGWKKVLFGVIWAAWLSLFPVPLTAQTDAQYEAARKRMVQEAVVGAGVTDRRVVQSLLTTPRHEFVSAAERKQAYFDMALPIGHQQTISSPFIVAYMTQSLDPQPTDKVLEIGTGSGYQAAVLSPLVKEVYSIEIVEPLGLQAERTLKRLKYSNVFVKVGDGYLGWPDRAPFDKIIVTCSPEKPPQPLIDQLREGGLMVIPTGERYQQTLYLMRKRDGKLQAEALQPTLFVPMTGTADQQREVQPDPKRPQVINGGFEVAAAANGHVPGWYYQRQATWVVDSQAPEGQHIVVFENQDQGRSSHLLQGLPIDGRQVTEIQLSAKVKAAGVSFPRSAEVFPSVGITFYDENRKDLGHHWLGPFRGTFDWRAESRRIRVPAQAREGLVRIGLFGATGQLACDDVRLEPVTR